MQDSHRPSRDSHVTCSRYRGQHTPCHRGALLLDFLWWSHGTWPPEL